MLLGLSEPKIFAHNIRSSPKTTEAYQLTVLKMVSKHGCQQTPIWPKRGGQINRPFLSAGAEIMAFLESVDAEAEVLLVRLLQLFSACDVEKFIGGQWFLLWIIYIGLWIIIL